MLFDIFKFLDPYEVIVFDFGGVLHQKQHHRTKRDTKQIIQDLKKIESIIDLLSFDHPLVILSNSPKKEIQKILKDAEMDIYFRRVYGGEKYQSKVKRLEKIRNQMGTENIILLDNNSFNI